MAIGGPKFNFVKVHLVVHEIKDITIRICHVPQYHTFKHSALSDLAPASEKVSSTGHLLNLIMETKFDIGDTRNEYEWQLIFILLERPADTRNTAK